MSYLCDWTPQRQEMVPLHAGNELMAQIKWLQESKQIQAERAEGRGGVQPPKSPKPKIHRADLKISRELGDRLYRQFEGFLQKFLIK